MSVFDLVALALALTPVAYLLVVAWPLARTDLREHRLPNALTLPGLALAFVAQTCASIVLGFGALSHNEDAWQGFANQGGALATAAVVFGFSLAAHVWLGLGMGDVKLLTVMALTLAWFNPFSPLLALMAGLAAAMVYVFSQVARRRAKLNSSLPLGPFLLLGFAASVASLAFGVLTPQVYRPGAVIDSTLSALSSCSSVSLTPST